MAALLPVVFLRLVLLSHRRRAVTPSTRWQLAAGNILYPIRVLLRGGMGTEHEPLTRNRFTSSVSGCISQVAGWLAGAVPGPGPGRLSVELNKEILSTLLKVTSALKRSTSSNFSLARGISFKSLL